MLIVTCEKARKEIGLLKGPKTRLPKAVATHVLDCDKCSGDLVDNIGPRIANGELSSLDLPHKLQAKLDKR